MIDQAFTFVDFLEFLEQNITPIVLLLLLPLHVAALWLTRREVQQRRDYMDRVEKAARVYSRAEYEFLISRAVQEAGEKIYCYWHSLHPPGRAAQKYRTLNAQLIEAHRNGVDVRLVVAKEPSRIASAYQLIAGGLDVRFQETLLVSDLRFSLFDDVTTVIGVPDAIDDPDTPSRKGIDVRNRKLTALLSSHFKDQWTKATAYDDFLHSVASEVLADDSTNSREMVADQLGIPKDELDRTCPRPGADDGP